MTASEVARVIDIDPANKVGLGRIFAILNTGRWGLGSTGWRSGNDWEIYLDRDIWRFKDVETVQDVLDIERGLVVEAPKPIGHSLIGKVVDMLGEGADETNSTDQVRTQPAATYVDERTIELLQAKEANGKFDLTKLLALIDELNDNYANKNTYSCLALIRAILDHAPPILGCKSFTEIASSYTSETWTRTDKDHAKSLRDNRSLGDDALHRMISKHVDSLSPDDIPAPARLRRLLQECVEQL